MSTENDAGVAGDNGGGADGGSRPGWMDSLPDAHKENAGFSQFQEASGAWDKFDSLLQAEGKTVVIPEEGATDEERAAFYSRLGRPETPDKYSFQKPDNFPEDIPYSPELETGFKQFVHDEGLSDKAAGKLFGWYHDMVVQGHEQEAKETAEATDKAMNALKDEPEWKGDAFTVNSERAHRAFSKFVTEDSVADNFLRTAKVDGVLLGNHPVFLKMFSDISKTVLDDSVHPGGAGSRGELSDEDKARERFPNTKFDD